jgi:hypothetical protein
METLTRSAPAKKLGVGWKSKKKYSMMQLVTIEKDAAKPLRILSAYLRERERERRGVS